MLRTTRTNFDRNESRRDRRYPLPLYVTLRGADYVSVNWSLGGFLLTADRLDLKVGMTVEGVLKVEERGDSFEFMAEVVRREREEGTIGFRFQDLPSTTMEILDRALARRLNRRRRP